MAGVLPVLIIIYAISCGVAMDTSETGSTGGESSQFAEPQICNCRQSRLVDSFFKLFCVCPELSSLSVSGNLSADSGITDFEVRCEQTSAVNTSGLFPASVKKLMLNNCFHQDIVKEVFYGLPKLENLNIGNTPKVVWTGSEVYVDEESEVDKIYSDESFSPVELDPELFLSMPQLETLTLRFLLLDRFPEALYQKVNGTNPLPNLKSLVFLGNRISYLKPEYLQHLTKLRSFSISINRISNLSASFPFLPGLEIIDVGNNLIHSLAGSPFQNLGNLTSLDLHGQYSLDVDKNSSKYNSSGIIGVGAMEFIFPTTFLGLLKLKSLTLAQSYIKSIPNGAFRELKNLEKLDISDGLVNYIGESAFQGLSLLKFLDLSKNNLIMIDPSVFDGLSSLLYLYLQNNFLIYLPPTTFENMRYLLNLNLANNFLSTLTRETLSPLQNLRTLNVQRNQLVNAAEVFFGITSESCEDIDLSYNNFQLLDPASLENLGIEHRSVNVNLTHNYLWFLNASAYSIASNARDLSLMLDLRWNRFTSLPFETSLFRKFSKSRIPMGYVRGWSQEYGDISLLMTNNPLVCDCGLYELISNLDVAKQGVLYTKTDFHEMECAFPDTLRGRKVVDLSPSELWCPNECDNRFYYCYCFEQAGKLFRTPLCETDWIMTCPSECSCSFQGQLHSSTATLNELVNCSRRNLSSIPDDISNVTTILHLEGNHLTVINQTVLPQLMMIRELFLNDNNITNIDDMSFNNFNSLEILRLDGNNISEINSQVFKFLSNLRELYLNHSGVRYLAANTFQDLVNLRKLHLENNKLKSLPENVFSGLKLTLLGIHGNPLTCSCDVLWFANWMQRRTHLLSQGRNVSCVASTKVTQDILSLSAAQFDCDELQAAQARNRVIVGVSIPLVLVIIILVCVIVAVKRKEAIQVYLYARYGWRFREEEEDDEDKEYDAFLSYSQHDLDVVLQDVLPALENREPPFRVCLHHRDFLPGVPIAENILNAVSASKRTIILLSNNFLESDWCQLEFQAAHAQMLQDRANRVIVILLDDIPAENAPADIQHYLKTNTYLKWGDERFWERLIYAMPRPRPHAQNEDGDQLAMVELDHNG